MASGAAMMRTGLAAAIGPVAGQLSRSFSPPEAGVMVAADGPGLVVTR
jgi:hypothetical protein